MTPRRRAGRRRAPCAGWRRSPQPSAVRVRATMHVLALDVGTSSVRACRFDESAEERDPARREYPQEDDPERVVALTREALEEAGGADGVDAVATSCFGHSLLAL